MKLFSTTNKLMIRFKKYEDKIFFLKGIKILFISGMSLSEKGKHIAPLFYYSQQFIGRLHHSAHAAAVSAHWRHRWRIFFHVSYHTLGSQQQGSDRSGIFQCETRYFGRINNSCRKQVFEGISSGIVAKSTIVFPDSVDN